MELYGSFTSPFARHCRIVLLETGAEHQFIETDNAKSATLSPTQKVPFLHYSEHNTVKHLNDSSAILKYLREQAGQSFFNDKVESLQQFDHFCTTNTLMDTTINVFYLEKDGLTENNSAYIARQKQRLETGLKALEALTLSHTAPFNDLELRIACFLDWALFRQRITLISYPRLNSFMDAIKNYPHFAITAPR